MNCTKCGRKAKRLSVYMDGAVRLCKKCDKERAEKRAARKEVNRVSTP